MIFQGEFNNSIDPKGRASIPAKFRDVLVDAYGDESLMVTKNVEGGLSAYPLSSWAKIVERVQQSLPGPEKNATIRLIIAPAAECGFDKQGRVLIPPALRSHAGLEKEIVVVGMFDKIDLYSQIRYAEVTRRSEDLLQNNPGFVAGVGL
jgi:MraZ protein